MSHIIATFESRPDAEAAMALLENAGVRDDQVSLAVTGEGGGKQFHIEGDEGVAAGATFGGVAGAILGSVIAAGTMAVPGLNLVVIGSMASGLAGLGAGAAAGGVVGALIGAGMTEHDGRLPEGVIRSGNILLAVRPDTDTQKSSIETILLNSDAASVED